MKILLGFALSFLFLHARTQAAFTAVETFDGLTLGALNGQNGWSSSSTGHTVGVDPANAANQVMLLVGGTPEATSYKTMPSIVDSSTAATVFMRFRMTGQNNMSWGTTDVAGPTAFGDYETQLNIQDTSSTTLRARSAGVAEPIEIIATNTWYSTWQVINNSTNTYQAYIQGGAFLTPTLLTDDDGANIGNSTFTFRNGAATNDLIRALIRTGANHTTNFYIDDIYVDLAGSNLIDPTVAIPEPGTWAALLIASVAGLGLKRKARKLA